MEIKSIKLDKKKKKEHEECIKLALEFLKLISTIIKLEFRRLVYEMHKNLTFNVFFFFKDNNFQYFNSTTIKK